jgi:outer membrane receptor protein involved in Fe transport
MNKLILSILILFYSINVFSEDTKPTEASLGTLKGFVFDANSNQPLEYATIAMISKRDNKVVNGTITDMTGFFKIKNVEFGMYNIDITFIGYKTKRLENIAIKPNDKNIDIGNIKVEPAVEKIGEAVVVADRPTMTYKIDKKVINVSQQHTSASGTAVEILETIPSVTVDIEGNVSLRGSESFTVLIDNKPTVLDPSDALSQIPATAIENIEVITNPSAKYDPDGTSGIINIITKKNKLQGFNGIANANVGRYGRYGGDILLNWRKERMNIFFGADYNNRSMVGDRDTENWTRQNDTTSYVLSNGDFERGGLSYSARGGIDFTLNPLNSISFEAQLGHFSRGGESNTNFEEYSIPTTTSDLYTSTEESERGGMYYNLSLNYTKTFLKKGHELYALINYRHRDNDEESTNKLVDINGVQTSGQKSEESGPSNSYRAQLDYALPFTNSKFEAGYSARIDLSNDIAEMYQYNTLTGDHDYMNDFYHDVSHENNIHSVYTMYSGEIGSFGYQGGLRGEYTYRDITLNETGESYLIDRFDFFPTAHISYSTAKENQWMANYSRRIRRPRGWNLEPFITWRDAYNVRQGNPALLPQYIDSYELSHLIKFGRNSFSIDGYYRVTNNKIERIRSAYEGYENVILSTYENVGKDYSLGIEMMLGIDIQKWWHLDVMGNIYDYRVEGELLGQDFSESSFNWNSRINNTFRLGKTTRVQFNGMYNSPTVSAQGERDGFMMANLAVRQSFMKNKLAATLQVRDVFGTMSHSSTYEGTDFYSYYDFQPNTPFVSLSLSFKINNYKPDRRKRSDGMDNMGGDEDF